MKYFSYGARTISQLVAPPLEERRTQGDIGLFDSLRDSWAAPNPISTVVEIEEGKFISFPERQTFEFSCFHLFLISLLLFPFLLDRESTLQENGILEKGDVNPGYKRDYCWKAEQIGFITDKVKHTLETTPATTEKRADTQPPSNSSRRIE